MAMAAALTVALSAPAEAAPRALTVEQQAHPLAVESARPLLGWDVGDPRIGARQSAYQVLVATAPDKLAEGRADVWDSGKVESSASTDVPYGGSALPSSQRLWWTVRTWDAAAKAGDWASPASFGTAVKGDWQGQPIWTSVPTLGSDYTLDADFTVTAVALGIKFRAAGGNGFMWQIRGDASNELRPHVQVNGTYTQMKAVKLPMTIGINTPHHVTITAVGSTITTSIDGVVVDTTVDARNPSGSIGFRTGSTESGTVDNVKVTSTGGSVLYSNDFQAPSTDFSCLTVGAGVLSVGKSKDCAYGLTDNWAFLRRRFAVADKPIAWATAYVTARSTEPAHQYVYKLSLNGTFVGVGPTRAITDSTTTMYNAYDVTSLLRRGEDNALGALAYTTTDKRFLAQLVIAYADGTRDVIATDDRWKTFAGAAALPDAGSIGTSYYAAPVENIDARVYPSGFDTPAFDDSAWPAANAKAAVPGLTGTPAAPVTQQLLAPAKITQVGDKHYVLDFGHTVVGGLQLSLTGAGGEAVEIRLGEELSSPTAVDYTLRAGNTYRDVWTLRPGAQTLSLWGYRVFRYAEVIGADLTPENVKAAALVYPYDANASSWSSSSAPLDQVFDFSRTGVRALNLDMHMDSPTRERAPYEGDNLIHMLVQGYDDGDWTNSRYTLEWLTVNETWPAEWRFSSILSTYEYWLDTGDIGPARDHYDDLKAFLPTKYLRSDGLVEKPPGSSSQANADLVDWPDAERDGYVFTTVNTVINAWSYRAFADMAELAAALGDDEDAATWNATAVKLRAAINEKLWDPVAGNYKDGLTTTHKAVHASVFPVAFGVAGPDQIGPATQYIADRGMVCSVFCANFLVSALYDGGRADDAMRMLTGTGQRSWLHMIAEGAGSPMEAWDPALKSNTTFSHPWAGSPAYLVYRSALGIQALEPGYARFAVKPQPGGLTHAEAVTPTVRGPIAAAFATTGDRMDLALGVPANSSAHVTLPAGDGDTVYVDHVARTATAGAVDVGAGCHLISTRAAGGTPDGVLAFAVAHGCDTTPPVLRLPGDQRVETTSAAGTPVSFNATATDALDGDVAVTCDPASSATFPLGTTTVTCSATDASGNTATGSFTVLVVDVARATGDVGGTVPATLSLTLGSAASFGAFTPGLEHDYTASTTATVTSTAGDAALTVSDPGHLGNGAFTLPAPLQVELSKAAWTGPVSNDPVAISFTQHIGATDALRTGIYSRTLTFTLSTTMP